MSGAGAYDRVSKGAKQGTVLAVGISAVVTGLILLLGRHLMGIFTQTPELADLSMRMMRVLAVGYLAMAIIQSLSGIMRGAGDTLTPMWISLLQTIVLRVPIAYLLINMSKTEQLPTGRGEFIYLSLVISWVIGMILTIIFYLRGKWKEKAL